MTKKEIEKGAGLLLAAVSGCEQMVELLRAAVHYCYDQEKTAKKLTPKGYAGFTRIHHIWTEGMMFPSCLLAAQFRIGTWQEEP